MKLLKYCFLLVITGKINVCNAQSPAGIAYNQKKGVIQQNFDGLPLSGSFTLSGKGPHLLSSIPIQAGNASGWQLFMTGGTGTNAAFLVSTGSGTGQGVYSAGSTGGTDRALGSLASGSGISAFGMVLTNLTGSILNTITVSFTAEQWRKGGSGNRNTWLCKYKTGLFEQLNQPGLNELSLLNFYSVNNTTGASALNGNLPENQVQINQTIRINDWKPGEQLLLRWDDTDETGSDDLAAIDQLSFSADFQAPEPVQINAISSLANNPTNADTIQYAVRFGGNISGLSAANFALKTSGLINAKITGIEGAATDYTATVFTGQGSGLLQLGIINDSNLIPGIQQIPFFSVDSQIIDKQGPVILNVSIPDKPMKSGDSIAVLIRIMNEVNNCSIAAGSIHEFPLKSIQKLSDSTYSSTIIIPASGTDLPAAAEIPVSLILLDTLGNKSQTYNQPIRQTADAIDMNKPVQLIFNSTSDSLLKSGDTLQLNLQFSEPVLIQAESPTNYIPVTIGSRVKNILYASGNNTTQLIFRYIIQPNESDRDGIRIASSFAAKNLLIKDLSGNAASLTINSTSIQHIKVDAIAPEFTAAGDTVIEICNSTARLSLDNYLKINNREPGETITWKLTVPPVNLSISKNTDQQNSLSATLLPNNFFVENNFSFSGLDSCIFSAADSINSVYKKIVFRFSKQIAGNGVSADQDLCNGSTPRLLNGSSKIATDSAAVYLWEYSTISDSSGFISGTGNNQQKDYQPAALVKNTWFRRKIISGPCISISNPILIRIWNSNLWQGQANSDWQNKLNWCNSTVPSDTSDILIPVNYINAPSVITMASAKKITLQKNTLLLVSGTLQISDQLVADSGSVSAETGTIVFNGKTLQTIDGIQFRNNNIGHLKIDNPAGVSLNHTINIHQTLSISKGIFYTGNRLYLKYKALVAASASGTSIDGEVIVEHTIMDSSNNYRLAGHPFRHFISTSQMNTGFKGFYNDPLSNKDSFSIAGNWKLLNPANPAAENNWNRHQGILVEPSAKPDSNALINFKGLLNHGLQEISLQRNNTAGFNLIANPFVSPVNISAFSNGRMVGRYYWIWNQKQGASGGYTAIPSNQSYVINPFEAFIAECRGATENELLIPEESKTSSWNVTGLPLFREDNGYFVEMSIYSEQQFWDRLILLETAGSKNYLDSIDAPKLSNNTLNFYSYSADRKKLSVDARTLNDNSIIPVRIETSLNKEFYLKVNQSFLPQNNQLVLHDRYTNQYLPLKKDSTYHFAFTADTLSKSADRFEISRFVEKGNIGQLIRYLTVKVFPNPAKNELIVTIKANKTGNTILHIYTMAGSLVKSVNLGDIQSGTAKITIAELAAGAYLLQVITGDQQKSLQFIKQ